MSRFVQPLKPSDPEFHPELNPQCRQCKDLFTLFSETEAKRSYAVELVQEALNSGDLQTREHWKTWITKAEKALY